MRTKLLLLLSAVIASAAVLTAPAVAQQKTVKACQAEWRANKAANQAAGITERAYVEKCRAGAATAPTATQAPAGTRQTPTTSTAAEPGGARKTAKACAAEWRANKAANQAAGITEKAYVEKCRAGVATAQPTTASPPAAATRAAPAPRTTAAPSAAPRPTAGAAAGAGQYASEAQAKARCPGDTVVWVNLDSKIYHYSSNRNFGHTKDGTYMCERDTAAGGFRPAKNEKHP